MIRRFRAIVLIAVAILALVGVVPTTAQAASRPAPKVVLIVGPAGGATPYYRELADETAAAAARLTSNVVKVYSPDATWERVKAALQGASIVVYLGHGNGWPSIYRNALYPPTQNGFGLNPHAGAADAHQYFGEASIASQIHLAPNALVVFSHLCYASGNTEPGLAEGTLDQAQQRVDNYAAGFFAAGARAVIADAYLSPRYYVTSVLRGSRSVEGIWRSAPNRNGHFLTFSSARTKGAIAEMDPDNVSSGFHRSIVLKPRLTSLQILGGAPPRSTVVEPVLEPSLVGLGVTFGAPDLSTPPTAGSATHLVLPMTKDASALLPDKVLVGTRWDRLDVPDADPAAPTSPAQVPAGAGGTPNASAPTPTNHGATRAPGSSGEPSNAVGNVRPESSPPAPDPAAPDATVPDLVAPEVAGEVVAPVTAKRLATGGLSVPVNVPTIPGLYRLVATIHEHDGLAFDAATQALLPALVVRVTGPRTAAYEVVAAANASAGHSLQLPVAVSNIGRTTWGRAAVVPGVGSAELEPASRATLVARWVSLGSALPSGTDPTTTAILPAGIAPGKTAVVVLGLQAPAAPGDYLVVLDVVDPDSGSLAALGVPPGIVRVSVGS
jgi:hypothetical protein